MKKIFYLSTLMLFLCGCVVKMPMRVQREYIDFSEFNKAGIFITESNSVSFEYESLGSLYVRVEPGYKNDRYIHVTVEDALNLFFISVIERGANGVINVNFQVINTPTKMDYLKEGEKSVEWNCGYIITGMAIKRK